MLKILAVRRNFYTIRLHFGTNFGHKIERKTTPKPKIAKTKKPYKTLAGAAKIKVWASKKRSKTVSKTLQKATLTKTGQETQKITIFEALGVHFGFQNPSKSTPKATPNEARFATPWYLPGSRRKSSGGRALRVSQGSFKGLGLLDRPSSP